MKNNIIIWSGISILFGFVVGFSVYQGMRALSVNMNSLFASVVSYQSATNIASSTTGVVHNISLPANSTTTILVFGDMMLDRAVRQKINENDAEYPFALIKDFLLGDGAGNDIVVANAEGPFTHFSSLTVGKKNAPLSFTFDPAVLPTLKNLGFTLLGQANNHTLNFGTAGLRESTSSIEKAGLGYFGDPLNKAVTPYVVEINGEKIGFIAYNEFTYKGYAKILDAIKEAKKSLSYIVVYPHWGDEYNLGFTASQQKAAHDFIDAGADVVLGAHPHVIEPIEIYNNKVIFYSLGNFIFDQAANSPTGRGLAVKIMLQKNFVTYEIFPISIQHQQASLMTDDLHQKELDGLSKSAVGADLFKDDIINGTISLPR